MSRVWNRYGFILIGVTGYTPIKLCSFYNKFCLYVNFCHGFCRLFHTLFNFKNQYLFFFWITFSLHIWYLSLGWCSFTFPISLSHEKKYIVLPILSLGPKGLEPRVGTHTASLPCRCCFILRHRKIRLIESNTKCCHLKKLTCTGTLRQVFNCLRPPLLLGFCLGW